MVRTSAFSLHEVKNHCSILRGEVTWSALHFKIISLLLQWKSTVRDKDKRKYESSLELMSLREFLGKLDVCVREREKSRMVPKLLPRVTEGCNFHPPRQLYLSQFHLTLAYVESWWIRENDSGLSWVQSRSVSNCICFLMETGNTVLDTWKISY